jgi:hypothetical protein
MQLTAGCYTGIRNWGGELEVVGGCCDRSEQKIFHTPYRVFLPLNTPWKRRKDVKQRRNRPRGMRAQILNPRGPLALLENRNELKLIRNSDSTYVNC